MLFFKPSFCIYNPQEGKWPQSADWVQGQVIHAAAVSAELAQAPF